MFCTKNEKSTNCPARTDAFALRDVLLDDLVELVEEGRGPCDVGLEAVRSIDRVHRLVQQLGVVADIVLIGRGHQDRHQDGAPALGHRPVLGEVAAHARHDIGAEPLDLLLDGGDVGRVRGVLDARGLRDHQDQLGVPLLATEPLLDEPGSFLEIDRVRQRVSEQAARDEADRPHERDHPGDHGPPWVAAAGSGERFRVDPHLGPLS